MRKVVLTGCVAAAIALATTSCGGGDGGGSPTGPTPTGGSPPASSVAIDITTTAGSQSFTPNPMPMTTAASVTWVNRDGAVHRIVANDGSFDTGDIAPGSTSRAVQPTAAGANYHCSIHPAMVGAIGAAQGAPPPPCTGEYCG